MSIQNYSDLVLACTNWLSRDDLTPRVPDFIVMWEAKANRTLRCSQMEQRSYTNIDWTAPEAQYVTLPPDFQAMRSVCLTSEPDKPRLQYLSDVQIKDLRANIGDTTATPQYFGLFGKEMELVPRPAANYEVEMIYRALLPPLSATNVSNWLLVIAPDAYLYGTLLEASILMKDDKRIPMWAEGLKQAVDSLNTLTTELVG